jgi:hypothetical protein
MHDFSPPGENILQITPQKKWGETRILPMKNPHF